ncbi:MAG: tetratricopeptide repeat protein [Opitutales bacterium]
MKIRRLIPIVVLFSVIGVDLWPVSPSDYRRRSPGTWRRQHDEKDYLFPGTGIFGKNRDPIESQQAKQWFLKAEDEEKKGDLRDALSYYEKFSKRRTDGRIIRDGTEIQIGPESLFRAARIQEERGAWPKAFERLRLIAEAYTEYDFDKVAGALMRLAERLAKEKQPRKWGILPRFRSGEQDRYRLNQIARLARGPKYAPRALMALAEIARKDDDEEEAVDALERLVNLYPDSHFCEKAYFDLAFIHESMVAGPDYDQGATLKALNFYEDYLILYETAPPKSRHETNDDLAARQVAAKERLAKAEDGRKRMREVLSASKLQVGRYLEKYGKYFIVRWRELGDGPALQFYNEAVTVAPDSESARAAEARMAELRGKE